MSSREPMDTDELHSRISAMPHWRIQEGALSRDFEFSGFVDAFRFMTGVALLAEKMDHHPDWSNSYNRVSIRLASHDVNGITTRDFRLAEAIDRLEPPTAVA